MAIIMQRENEKTVAHGMAAQARSSRADAELAALTAATIAEVRETCKGRRIALGMGY